MRKVVRTLVETIAVHGGLTSFGRRRTRDRIAVVAYHNVVPRHETGHGDSSLHISMDRFLEQIDRLAETHEIVDLRNGAAQDQAGGSRSRPARTRPRAVVTFDDAYRGAILHAIPELKARGVPAVVFVAPALLGAASTWWDELGETGALTPKNRMAALEELGGDPAAVRERYLRGERPRLPDCYRIATQTELDSVIGGVISVGSHTWSHEHLPSLEETALEATLERSLEWVRALGHDGCPWLALPFGAGTPATSRVALRVGYDGVFRISGGLWQPQRGTAAVPRINVPAGLSSAGLALRTSGLLA